jgi:hypothetical protein
VRHRRVSFTITARHQVDLEHEWWRDNRDQRQLFEDELGAALNLVALLPGIGTPYELSPIAGVRRLYLEKIDLPSVLHLRRQACRRSILVGCQAGPRAIALSLRSK